MFFDIICVIFCIIAIVKGIQRGLVHAVFSFIGFFAALMLARNLSEDLADLIKNNTPLFGKWSRPLAFFLIFIGVLLLVHIIVKSVEAGLSLVMLGWFNKIGGVIIYLLMYVLMMGTIHYIMQLVPYTSGFLSDSSFSPYLKDIIPRIKHFIE